MFNATKNHTALLRSGERVKMREMTDDLLREAINKYQARRNAVEDKNGAMNYFLDLMVDLSDSTY